MGKRPAWAQKTQNQAMPRTASSAGRCPSRRGLVVPSVVQRRARSETDPVALFEGAGARPMRTVNRQCLCWRLAADQHSVKHCWHAGGGPHQLVGAHPVNQQLIVSHPELRWWRFLSPEQRLKIGANTARIVPFTSRVRVSIAERIEALFPVRGKLTRPSARASSYRSSLFPDLEAKALICPGEFEQPVHLERAHVGSVSAVTSISQGNRVVRTARSDVPQGRRDSSNVRSARIVARFTRNGHGYVAHVRAPDCRSTVKARAGAEVPRTTANLLEWGAKTLRSGKRALPESPRAPECRSR